jgi:hypothetical protein
MAARIRGFLHFWYDFVIGDDWRIAAGVVCAFLITWAVSTTTAAAWWVTPLAVFLLLPLSVARAVYGRR